ncbi:MAG: hypothetical protein KKA81_08355, partial [Bacteroidetes bacterium]|nr:hypothetical protein [Bacteroidota bacterium]
MLKIESRYKAQKIFYKRFLTNIRRGIGKKSQGGWGIMLGCPVPACAGMPDPGLRRDVPVFAGMPRVSPGCPGLHRDDGDARSRLSPGCPGFTGMSRLTPGCPGFHRGDGCQIPAYAGMTAWCLIKQRRGAAGEARRPTLFLIIR